MEHYVGTAMVLTTTESIDYDLSLSERAALAENDQLFQDWSFTWTCELFELDEADDNSVENLASLQVAGTNAPLV